ncbi:hypothetical protein Y032_0017g3373 [Ancylostoma ceylanicum]|uniref:Uncharacterized protein n=1 Tax=Ancylostoma ceylanicum TaxID=53326 RepID=A0A016V6X2_9BILA|nr:hypothetical protein Y032_0017g3373 [Ancylostoma ceylanicum]
MPHEGNASEASTKRSLRVRRQPDDQDFIVLRACTLSGKLVRAVDAWNTTPSLLVFRRVSRYSTTANDIIFAEIPRNLAESSTQNFPYEKTYQRGDSL